MRQGYILKLDGVTERTLGVMTTPDGVLDRLYSDKTMGVTLDKVRGTTTYRLFAPRAKCVAVFLRSPAGGVVDADIPSLPAGGGVPDVAGPGGWRCGKSQVLN